MYMKKVFVLTISIAFSFALFAQKGKVNGAYNLILAKDLEKAIVKLNEAEVHEKTKDWPKTYYVKGKFFQELHASENQALKGQYENILELAFKNYKKAYELDTMGKLKNFMNLDAYELYNKLFTDGVSKFGENKYKEATQVWEYALESRNFTSLFNNETDTSIMYNIALAALNGQLYDKCIDYLKKVADLNYGGANVFVLMKNAYVEKGDTASALKALQDGFEKFPDDQAVIVELINYYLSSNQSQAALEYLAIAKEQDPSNPTFYHAEGVLYDKMGNFEKSIESYNKAIEVNPDYFDSQYNLGVIHFNKAVVVYEEGVMSTDDRVYERKIKEANETFKIAVPYFEKCLEIVDENDPDDKANLISTLENLSVLYYRLQMTDKHEEVKAKLDSLKAPVQ